MFLKVNEISKLIGNTPILKLSKICNNNNLKSEIYAKLECFNPAGSIKDRTAFSMISEAEKEGKLNENSVIIEPTSGNTGIALAFISSIKKYKLFLTMPESMSIERRNLLKSFGANIILTSAQNGMKGAIAEAEKFMKKNKNSFMPQQFKNPANPKIHRETTGPEIFEAMNKSFDFLIAGVGTGGTITGVGEFLKSKNKNIKIIAVEPATSSVLSGKKSGPHSIQGIGAGFIPDVLNKDVIDEIVAVTNDEAYTKTLEIATTEGILVGISSGAALAAAQKIAQKHQNKKIVVIFPDTGERYLSTGVFNR